MIRRVAPWVAGTWDETATPDGIADRLQVTRYTASGVEDVGLIPTSGTEDALDVFGGGGVDASSGGAVDQPWVIFDRDVEPDGTRNDIASRRYDPTTGLDSLGYGLDVANPQIGSMLRSGGMLQTNSAGNPVTPNHQLTLSILESGPNAGKVQISRFNDLGLEPFGGVVNFGAPNDLIPSTVSGIGGGQSGRIADQHRPVVAVHGGNQQHRRRRN